MSVADAFRTFQGVVNAEIEAVREARSRRDLFKGAFGTEDDVLEVLPSGSLARGTQKDPIHDVDVILIYDAAEHPDWGKPGTSAEDALDHVRGRVNSLLGATGGTYRTEVRLARWRNHAVKCFFDDPDDPDGFTVDAMPALRSEGMFLIPEAVSNDWVAADPEYLISEIAKKHATWDKFCGTVRMLKSWAASQDIKIKSLVMEVLAYELLPTMGSQPTALKEFFVKASYFIDGGGEVADPADVCGPIQGDLDYGKFGDLLRAAADSASSAIQAQFVNNDIAGAIRHWGDVFGDEFPKPPKSSEPAMPPVVPRPVKDTPQG